MRWTDQPALAVRVELDEEFGVTALKLADGTDVLMYASPEMTPPSPGPKIAWFEDPSGNVIAVMQQP